MIFFRQLAGRTTAGLYRQTDNYIYKGQLSCLSNISDNLDNCICLIFGMFRAIALAKTFILFGLSPNICPQNQILFWTDKTKSPI